MFGIPEDLGEILQSLPCLRTLEVWPEQVRDISTCLQCYF